MTEESRLSYSYTLQTGAPAPAGKATVDKLVALDEYDVLAVAGGILMIGRTTGAQVIVQPEVQSVLGHCDVFRSLEDHARRLAEVVPQLAGNVEDARRVLGQIHDAGLFVDAESFCQSVNAQPPEARNPGPCKVFVITAGRLQALARILDSMLANARLAASRSLYVIDDSRAQEDCRSNRELVERLSHTCPVPLVYFGPEEQARFMDQLKSALPGEHEAIEFLLGKARWTPQPTFGRARNLCLLLSVGERALIFDDDVLCEARQPVDAGGKLEFSDGLRETRFYASDDEWRQGTRSCDFDPIAGQARSLGQTLAAVLADYGLDSLEPDMLRGVPLRQLQALRHDSPVLVTQAGTLGDPGTRGNGWIAYLMPDQQRAMLQSSGGMRGAMGRCPVWRGKAGPTLIRRAVMSQLTGLDNSRALPPYFPALRGEDLLFGYLVEYLFPDGLVMECDWAVPHLPMEARHSNPEGDSLVPRGGMELVASFLDESRPRDIGVSFDARLQVVVAKLRELGELSDAGLKARFRKLLSSARVLTLQVLSDRRQQTGELDPMWGDYLHRNIKACAEALQQPAELTDLEDAAGLAEGPLLALVRQHSLGFADALAAWGSIRTAASSLQDSA